MLPELYGTRALCTSPITEDCKKYCRRKVCYPVISAASLRDALSMRSLDYKIYCFPNSWRVSNDEENKCIAE